MNLLDRKNFVLRRIHSLTGVFPIGVFLINHFFANSYAVLGADAYNNHARLILGLPYLYVVEMLFVFLPLLFHGLLGIWIIFTGEINVGTQNRFRNWMYVLQRVSGVFLLLFITLHVASTRFNPEREHGLYQMMAGHFQDPWYMWFYVAGILAATYHFANGLWGFAVTWGITVSPTAQRMSTYICAAIFVVLSFVGLNTVFAFTGSGMMFLNPPPGGH